MPTGYLQLTADSSLRYPPAVEPPYLSLRPLRVPPMTPTPAATTDVPRSVSFPLYSAASETIHSRMVSPDLGFSSKRSLIPEQPQTDIQIRSTRLVEADPPRLSLAIQWHPALHAAFVRNLLHNTSRGRRKRQSIIQSPEIAKTPRIAGLPIAESLQPCNLKPLQTLSLAEV